MMDGHPLPGYSGRVRHSASDLGFRGSRAEFSGDTSHEVVASMRLHLDWLRQHRSDQDYMDGVARRVHAIRGAEIRTDSALNFLVDLERAEVIYLWQEVDGN